MAVASNTARCEYVREGSCDSSSTRSFVCVARLDDGVEPERSVVSFATEVRAFRDGAGEGSSPADDAGLGRESSSSTTASNRITYCPVSVNSSRARPEKFLRAGASKSQARSTEFVRPKLVQTVAGSHLLILAIFCPVSFSTTKSHASNPASTLPNCCISSSLGTVPSLFCA